MQTFFNTHLGIVAAVKGSYGFIKRDKSRIDRKNQESRIFFHSSEILDANSKLGRRRIKMGNEVSVDSSWTVQRLQVRGYKSVATSQRLQPLTFFYRSSSRSCQTQFQKLINAVGAMLLV